MIVLRLIAQCVRLPFDLVFLTVDLARLMLWVLWTGLLRLLGQRPSSWGPFVSETQSGSGAPLCVGARKYGTLSVFRCLCPAARADENGERICTYVGEYAKDAYVPYWGRVCVLGMLLGGLWLGLAVAGGLWWQRGVSGGGEPAREAPEALHDRQEGATARARRGAGGTASPSAEPIADVELEPQKKVSQPTIASGGQGEVASTEVRAEDTGVLPSVERPGPSTSPEPRDRAQQFLASGDRYYAGKRYAEAMIEYRNAAQRAPTSARARLGMGRCWLRQHRNGREARRLLKEAARLEPGLADAHLELARLALARRDVEEAIAHAEALRELRPKEAEAHRLLSACHVARRDLESAFLEIKEAIALDDTHAPTFVSAGQLYTRQRELAEAERCFRRAIDLDLSLDAARLGLARLLQRRGDTKAAQEQIQVVLERDPDSVAALTAQAELNVARGHLPPALTAYRTLVRRLPGNHAARARLADLLVVADQADEAYTVATQLLRDCPGHVAAHGVLAGLFFKKGLYSLAAEHCQKALVTDAKNLTTRRLLAQAYTGKRDYRRAIAELEKALDVSPDDLDARLMLGRAYHGAGITDKALACYQEAAARFPASALPHVHMGHFYRARGQTSEAISNYELALLKAPDDAVAANNLASLLLDAGRNLDRAYSLAARVRRRFPRDPTFADTFGWACLAEGKVEEAVAALSFAARGRPQSPLIHYHLGAALHRKGDLTGAAGELEVALAISKGFEGAERAHALLAAIRATRDGQQKGVTATPAKP